MSITQHEFVAEQYGSRAEEYVRSETHSSGDDLDQVEAVVRGRREARVLDLGCGGGHVSYRVAPHVAEVVACDLTPSMLEVVARTAAERGLRNIRVQQAAAERLPFGDGTFDLVLCRFSVHHWQDADAGLREARRVLKPGGRAVFIDVVAPPDRVLDTHLQAVELLRDPSHVRDLSVAEWAGALGRSSFVIESMTPRRLRMHFTAWIARTHTPPNHADAIRSLQVNSPASVREHFTIAPDGSFDLDTVTIGVVTA